MKYKLVVTDMDGTFLNSKNQISNENLKIVEELREKGILFSIATGRLDTMIKEYLKKIGNNNPVISCNGALVRDPSKEEFYHREFIEREKFLKVIELCKKYDIIFHVYTQETIYSETTEGRVKYLLAYNETLSEEDKMDIRIIDSIYNLGKEVEIFKVLMVSDDFELLEKAKEEINYLGGLEACKSAPHLLDIMKAGVTKGNALKKLAEILNIKREEIIAIGDNHNDRSMLEYAGFSIVMGNGEESVKKIADYVTDSNDEDGVAKALRWVFKL